MKEKHVLVLDVGGTHTKIALTLKGKIISKEVISTKKFNVMALKKIIEAQKKAKKEISSVVLATAGPVTDGKCQLANAELFLDENSIERMIGIPVMLLNDLEAAAYYLGQKNKNVLLIGLGTGLGTGLIDENGHIIPSEEGHTLLDRELFFSIPELSSTIIPQYENILGGKKNILIKLFKRRGKGVPLKNKENDRFTEIYLRVLDAFVQKLIYSHSRIKINKIIFLGGIATGNKNVLSGYLEHIKHKFDADAEISDDEFSGIKGAIIFYREKQKSL